MRGPLKASRRRALPSFPSRLTQSLRQADHIPDPLPLHHPRLLLGLCALSSFPCPSLSLSLSLSFSLSPPPPSAVVLALPSPHPPSPQTDLTPLVKGYGGFNLNVEIVPMESAYPGYGDIVVKPMHSNIVLPSCAIRRPNIRGMHIRYCTACRDGAITCAPLDVTGY